MQVSKRSALGPILWYLQGSSAQPSLARKRFIFGLVFSYFLDFIFGFGLFLYFAKVSLDVPLSF